MALHHPPRRRLLRPHALGETRAAAEAGGGAALCGHAAQRHAEPHPRLHPEVPSPGPASESRYPRPSRAAPRPNRAAPHPSLPVARDVPRRRRTRHYAVTPPHPRACRLIQLGGPVVRSRPQYLGRKRIHRTGAQARHANRSMSTPAPAPERQQCKTSPLRG